MASPTYFSSFPHKSGLAMGILIVIQYLAFQKAAENLKVTHMDKIFPVSTAYTQVMTSSRVYYLLDTLRESFQPGVSKYLRCTSYAVLVLHSDGKGGSQACFRRTV